METLSLFRAGRHLVLGTQISAVRGVALIQAQYQMAEAGLRPLQGDRLEVCSRFIIDPAYKVEGLPVMEAEAGEFASLIHESVMPLVSSMRRVDLPSTSLVAYERSARGLGFATGAKVEWVPLENALRNEELGQLLALEAKKRVLEALGLWDRTRPERVDEQYHLMDRPLHVYMKAGPFHDISKIYEGTNVRVAGYFKGCAIIEADSEEFWTPLEEARYIPVQKDDWYYFTLDGVRNLIPDPLEFLPSKSFSGACTGDAAREDNWNAQPDLVRVAGNFYAVPEIPNDDFALLSDERPVKTVDAAVDSVASGADPKTAIDGLMS